MRTKTNPDPLTTRIMNFLKVKTHELVKRLAVTHEHNDTDCGEEEKKAGTNTVQKLYSGAL